MSLFPKCFDCDAMLVRPHPSRPSTCRDCRGPRGGPRAGAIVQKAIREGLLPHPTTRLCEDCGKPARVYDHRDYNRPLMVEAVCGGCNIRRGPATRWTVAAEQARLMRDGMSFIDALKAAGGLILPPTDPQQARAA